MSAAKITSKDWWEEVSVLLTVINAVIWQRVVGIPSCYQSAD